MFSNRPFTVCLGHIQKKWFSIEFISEIRYKFFCNCKMCGRAKGIRKSKAHSEGTRRMIGSAANKTGIYTAYTHKASTYWFARFSCYYLCAVCSYRNFVGMYIAYICLCSFKFQPLSRRFPLIHCGKKLDCCRRSERRRKKRSFSLKEIGFQHFQYLFTISYTRWSLISIKRSIEMCNCASKFRCICFVLRGSSEARIFFWKSPFHFVVFGFACVNMYCLARPAKQRSHHVKHACLPLLCANLLSSVFSLVFSIDHFGLCIIVSFYFLVLAAHQRTIIFE